MPSLALLKVFRKKTLDDGNIGYGIVFTHRKNISYCLTWCFFYQSLSVVMRVALLMNSLNFLSEIRNNMFQLMVMILNSLMWSLVFHKSHLLV